MTTTQQLKNLGSQAREQFDTPVHNCREVSEAFTQLCDQKNIPAERQTRSIGEKRVTHHIVMLSSKEISDIPIDSGVTFIDPTISQFTLQNWQNGITETALGQEQNLPEVGIYPPTAEEREVWYYRK